MSDKTTESLFMKAMDAFIKEDRERMMIFEAMDEVGPNGEPLYWHDKKGWVPRAEAQLYKPKQHPKGDIEGQRIRAFSSHRR